VHIFQDGSLTLFIKCRFGLNSLDNSDWMRNGDYFPTRLDAQHDAGGVICDAFMYMFVILVLWANIVSVFVIAVNLLCTARTDSHPENTIGLLTMAGKG